VLRRGLRAVRAAELSVAADPGRPRAGARRVGRRARRRGPAAGAGHGRRGAFLAPLQLVVMHPPARLPAPGIAETAPAIVHSDPDGSESSQPPRPLAGRRRRRRNEMPRCWNGPWDHRNTRSTMPAGPVIRSHPPPSAHSRSPRRRQAIPCSPCGPRAGHPTETRRLIGACARWPWHNRRKSLLKVFPRSSGHVRCPGR
jgi:hypothetical protein